MTEFPPFEAGNALTEMGKLGKKSVNKDIEAIGEAYRELAAYLVSDDFINVMQRITGIDNLIAIPGEQGYPREPQRG